jgi:hypothetical protein
VRIRCGEGEDICSNFALSQVGCYCKSRDRFVKKTDSIFRDSTPTFSWQLLVFYICRPSHIVLVASSSACDFLKSELENTAQSCIRKHTCLHNRFLILFDGHYGQLSEGSHSQPEINCLARSIAICKRKYNYYLHSSRYVRSK